MDNPASKASDERSNAPRIAVRQHAKLIDSDGGMLDVVVTDISKDGFRLEASEVLQVAEFVHIRVKGYGDFPAQIKWARQLEAGGARARLCWRHDPPRRDGHRTRTVDRGVPGRSPRVPPPPGDAAHLVREVRAPVRRAVRLRLEPARDQSHGKTRGDDPALNRQAALKVRRR